MAALPFIAGDMLGRRSLGFAGKLGKACLMHAMPARGIDADSPDMVQALDQAEHRGRLCRLRHLAQPAEPALAAFRPALRQRIQLPTLLGGQPIGQPTLDLSPRLKAEINTETFEAPRRRNNDPPPTAFLHDQLGQMEEAIILKGLRMKGVGEFCRGAFSKGAQPKPVLAFGGVSLSIALCREIRLDRCQEERRSALPQRRSALPAAAHRLAADDPDSANSTASVRSRGGCDRPDTAGSIARSRGGQRIVADQFTRLRERIEQRGDLGLGQLLSAHRSCSPQVSRRQTSRSEPGSR